MVPLGGFVKFFGDADGASTPDREGVARLGIRAAGRLDRQDSQTPPVGDRAQRVKPGIARGRTGDAMINDKPNGETRC